jgi:outer membrane biosynthesis protein TonB
MLGTSSLKTTINNTRTKQQPTTNNQQTNKPTNQQTNKPTNQQTNKPTNQQTNKPTNKQTNKPTTKTTTTTTGNSKNLQPSLLTLPTTTRIQLEYHATVAFSTFFSLSPAPLINRSTYHINLEN